MRWGGGAVYIGFPRTREGPGWNGDSLEQFKQIKDPVKTLCDWSHTALSQLA